MQKSYLWCLVWIVVVVGIGSLIGINFPPGAWHEGLIKPFFNPPGWLFGPVWTALYILIAIAGWRVFNLLNDTGLKTLWVAQMVLNFLWSPAFFGAESTMLGLIVILPMLLTIYLFIFRAFRLDRVSAWLFLPYAAWVSFATLLNGALHVLNN